MNESFTPSTSNADQTPDLSHFQGPNAEEVQAEQNRVNVMREEEKKLINNSEAYFNSLIKRFSAEEFKNKARALKDAYQGYVRALKNPRKGNEVVNDPDLTFIFREGPNSFMDLSDVLNLDKETNSQQIFVAITTLIENSYKPVENSAKPAA